MRKIRAILSVLSLLMMGCANDEANTAERAEREWNDFIQRHLVGEWKPESISVKSVEDQTVLDVAYSNLGSSKDRVVLHKDFTGQLKRYEAEEEAKIIAFTWYHKLDEFGLQLEDGRILKAVLRNKSQEELKVALALEQVYDDLKNLLPELADWPMEDYKTRMVHFRFVK